MLYYVEVYRWGKRATKDESYEKNCNADLSIHCKSICKLRDIICYSFKKKEINQTICELILENFIVYSVQKFSSNVIEKLLEQNTEEMNSILIDSLMYDYSNELFYLISD